MGLRLKYEWEGKLPRYFVMTDGKYAVRHFDDKGWCVCEQPATRKTIVSHSWASVTEALHYAETMRDQDGG